MMSQNSSQDTAKLKSMSASMNVASLSTPFDALLAYETPHPNELEKQHPALSRFHKLERIGSGAQGTMLRAIQEDATPVAIKVFDFQSIDDLKSLELFEREISTLRSLHIKGVPRYMDTIKSDRYIYLVETYIEAPSLETRIQRGDRYTFDQILTITCNAAQILKELNDFVPPVIHRDIKPGNILVDDALQVYLVDFGVTASPKPSSLAMTFAGTAGYLAPELLFNKITPAADVYSLGMTLIHLITHTSPCDMMTDDMTIDFKRFIPSNVPQWFVELLKKMTCPQVGKRLKTGQEIIAFIHDHLPPLSLTTPTITTPTTTQPNAHTPSAITLISAPPKASTSKSPSPDQTSIQTETPKDDEKNAILNCRHELNQAYVSFKQFDNDFISSYIHTFIIMIFILMPFFFFIGNIAMNASYFTFITDWLPIFIPFLMLFISCLPNDIATPMSYNDKRNTYVDCATKLNQVYKEALTNSSKTLLDSCHADKFHELYDKLNYPERFTKEEIVPLSDEENKRLDKYMLNYAEILYPCIEYNMDDSCNKMRVVWTSIIYIILSVILLWVIPTLANVGLGWLCFYYIACCFSIFRGIYHYIKFFKYQMPRLKDPRNAEAYQLYERRFLSECKNTKNTKK